MNEISISFKISSNDNVSIDLLVEKLATILSNIYAHNAPDVPDAPNGQDTPLIHKKMSRIEKSEITKNKIRNAYKPGMTLKDISKATSLSASTVSRYANCALTSEQLKEVNQAFHNCMSKNGKYSRRTEHHNAIKRPFRPYQLGPELG